MVYEPLASGCCFFTCNLNYFSQTQAFTQLPMLSPGGLQDVGLLWLQCIWEGFPGGICEPKLGKGGAATQSLHLSASPDHHLVLCHIPAKLLMRNLIR